MKKAVLIAAIGAMPSAVLADYQFELAGIYGQSEQEYLIVTSTALTLGGTVTFTDQVTVDYDDYALFGRFHLSEVKTDHGPQSEAGFLSHSSYLDFGYIVSEPDEDSYDDYKSYAIGGRFVSGKDIIFELDYSKAEIDSFDTDSVRGGVGAYLNKTTSLLVSYETSTDDNNDTDIISASLHGLGELSSASWIGYDIDASYIDLEEEDGFGIEVGAMYYPTSLFGLGFSAGIQEIGDIKSDRVAAEISFFPVPELELAAMIYDESTELDAIKLDGEGFLLSASLRF
jgi:hypothetical protein